VKNVYLGLKFAISYFTVIPIRFGSDDDLSSKRVLGWMLWWFPLVGLLLAGLSVSLYHILYPLGWLGALVSALFYMLLYGFLHTEAVLDVADALYASHSTKDAYSIIKDPTVGAMGVLWAMATVLLKVSALTYLLLHGLFWQFILIAMLSRYSLLVHFYTQKFRSSFATALKESLSFKSLISSLAMVSSIGFLLLGWGYMILLISSLLISYILLSKIKNSLRFVNGDVLGATLEGVESMSFMIVAYIWL